MDIIKNNIHWLLRLSLATTFIVHGYPKLVDPSGLISMGLPNFIAYLVGPFEFFGGVMLVIGALAHNEKFNYITKIGALLIAIIMLGAIFVVHLGDGWKGNEFQVLILAVCLLFIFKGNKV